MSTNIGHFMVSSDRASCCMDEHHGAGYPLNHKLRVSISGNIVEHLRGISENNILDSPVVSLQSKCRVKLEEGILQIVNIIYYGSSEK